MITVKAIYTAPVKSLGLQSPDTVRLDSRGIVGDRRFYLINQQGRLLTQREMGKLVQVQARYDMDPERLKLVFPDGGVVDGELKLGRAIGTVVWGRRVRGHILDGDWNEALSQLVAPDPRCSIITQDPATGERDIDTVSLIQSYRPGVGTAYFGVYGIVDQLGTVSVGDEVKVC